MKRFLIFMFLSGLALNGIFAQAGKGSVMYVALKTAVLKSSTGFFADTLETLQQGDAVTVLQEKDKWVQVRSAANPSLTGWMALTSLTSKRITAAGRSASASELALAGKGFSGVLETTYQQETALSYTAIDALELQNIPGRDLRAFLVEGHLALGD